MITIKMRTCAESNGKHYNHGEELVIGIDIDEKLANSLVNARYASIIKTDNVESLTTQEIKAEIAKTDEIKADETTAETLVQPASIEEKPKRNRRKKQEGVVNEV